MAEAKRLADVVRAKDPMEALCKERLITSEACDWLKYAVDPFHDLQLDSLRGYPDVSTEPTVVVKVRQAVTVTHPPIGAHYHDGDTWNCHVILSPVDFAPPVIDGATNTTGVAQARATPHTLLSTGSPPQVAGAVDVTGGSALEEIGRMDGLVINSVRDVPGDSSMTFTPGHCPADAVDGYAMTGLHLDKYLDFGSTELGVYRVIYSGFEVVNTTAQIYKQGAVTVYEYGNSYEMAAATVDNQAIPPDTNNLQDQFPCTYFRTPPNNLAEAKIMPGSHSWAASDGTYNTAKFQSDNPFQGITGRNFVFAQNEDRGSLEGGYRNGLGQLGYGSAASRGLTSVALERFPSPTHFSRMNTCGAYFTGLSYQTSLFVTWRVGLERLPAALKPTFLALAQPSAKYDPNALVLYNLVANALPPGCPQGYNDAGKWFRWISEAASKAIPTVYPAVRTAAMIANSMGRPVIGGVLGGLATALKAPAEKMAAQRLQAAQRRKAGPSGAKRQPAREKNWQQPGPRGGKAGGVNGLR